MNKVGLLFPILNITMLMVIAVSFFSPRNADYYMLMLVFLLAAVVSSFVSIFTIRRMLAGYVECYMLIAIISSIGFYLLNRGSGAWSEGLISFNVFMVLFQAESQPDQSFHLKQIEREIVKEKSFED